MFQRTLRISALLLATCLLTVPLAAEELKGFRADFLNDFDRTSEKLMDLAKEIPRDKFSWRPSEEVRSVSEIYMHVASANFFFARDLGIPLPADLPEELEENVTQSAEVRILFAESLDHVRQAVKKNEDLEQKIELFGKKRSVRSVFMILSGHAHEHLGQMIAYARGMSIVPPWSK